MSLAAQGCVAQSAGERQPWRVGPHLLPSLPAMPLSAGSRLGPYEILSPLGAGGMGEVYSARDTRLDRTVAVKVLSGHLSSDPMLRQRFEREARAVSGLNHPVAVVGDSLFAGSMGGGAVSYQDALRNNREKILTLPDETIVCPGHGPLTTVGLEKKHHPFFPS